MTDIVDEAKKLIEGVTDVPGAIAEITEAYDLSLREVHNHEYWEEEQHHRVFEATNKALACAHIEREFYTIVPRLIEEVERLRDGGYGAGTYILHTDLSEMIQDTLNLRRQLAVAKEALKKAQKGLDLFGSCTLSPDDISGQTMYANACEIRLSNRAALAKIDKGGE